MHVFYYLVNSQLFGMNKWWRHEGAPPLDQRSFRLNTPLCVRATAIGLPFSKKHRIHNQEWNTELNIKYMFPVYYNSSLLEKKN